MSPQKLRKQKKVITTKSSPIYLYLGIIIAIYAFFLYANTLSHGYVLDDYSVIKDNWVVKKGVDGIPTILKTTYRYGFWNNAENTYRPLSLILFAIEWELFPDKAFFGHLVNIFLYCLTGFLLFRLLKRILHPVNYIIPFVTTLLFIAHPVHTEVVANIKSSDTILEFLFLILSLNYLWNYLEKNAIKNLFISVFCFFLAFLSKESAVTFLAIIPLLLFVFKDIKIKRIALLMIPYFLATMLFLIIRQSVITGNDVTALIDNYLVGAPNITIRIATAFFLLGKYILLLFYPYPLVSDYSFNQLPLYRISDVPAIIGFLICIGLFVYALLFIKKQKLISFGILFFFITISIVSNVIMVIGTHFGERLLYIPSLGFCLSITVLITLFVKVKKEEENLTSLSEFVNQNKLVLIIVIPILFIFSFKTISRNRFWESEYVLYTEDIKYSPNSARLHYYYGLVLMKEKAMKSDNEKTKVEYLDKSIEEFKRSAAIYPSYADAWSNMALAYFRKNDFAKALEYYNLSLKYNPTASEVYSNMGNIFFLNRDYQKAIEVFQKAIQYNPRFSDAYLNLGSTYGTIGKYDLAIVNFKKCIEYKPENASAYYFLGLTYQNLGDKQNGDYYLSLAAKMDSQFAAK